jgi:FeS assembly protein IscX
MSVAKALKWTDTLDIAMALAEAHADADVKHLRFTDLHRWVTELDGFVDDPQKSNEKILEAIQMAWLDEIE